ncbi:MAG: DnaD domain protein, partial [Oscillospiraceae bacterium]
KRLAQLERQNSVEEILRREMELSGKLSKEQSEFIRKWTAEWSFSTEMIMLAYETAVNNTGSVSFKYMNKVLENWLADGATDPEAVIQKNAARKSAKSAAQSGDSSFDMDDVLQQIRSKYKNTQGS